MQVMQRPYCPVSPFNDCLPEVPRRQGPSGADPYGGGVNPGGWSFENGDWYDNRSPQVWNNNVTNEYMMYGSYAPGSQGDWDVGMRSLRQNMAIMSRAQLLRHSGLDIWDRQQKFSLAKRAGEAYNPKDPEHSKMFRLGVFKWNPNGGATNVAIAEWLDEASPENIARFMTAKQAGLNPGFTLGSWVLLGDFSIVGFQDGIPTNKKLNEWFKDSFKKNFYDPLKLKVSKGKFTSSDVLSYIQSFDYQEVWASKPNIGLRPVLGGRYQVLNKSGNQIQNIFPLFTDVPRYFGIEGKVTNPGMGIINFNTSDGMTVRFTINFEFYVFN